MAAAGPVQASAELMCHLHGRVFLKRKALKLTYFPWMDKEARDVIVFGKDIVSFKRKEILRVENGGLERWLSSYKS